jgi:hypothetical protein
MMRYASLVNVSGPEGALGIVNAEFDDGVLIGTGGIVAALFGPM